MPNLAVLISLLVLPFTANDGVVPASETSVSAEPREIVLHGHRASQQILVSGTFADLTGGDLTGQATYLSTMPSVAVVTASGLVIPRADGKAEIVVSLHGKSVTVPVLVQDYDQPHPIDFQTDVIAALSKAGCNQGACHGSPQGKNGFRLSLRGFDPTLDFTTLTHEDYGRRTNPNSPDLSLVLRKGLNDVPHQGGRRFRKTDPEYQILRGWIVNGCKPSPGQTTNSSPKPGPGNAVKSTVPTLVKLEVLPGSRKLAPQFPRQQLVTVAHFSDGRRVDVTNLTVFTTNEKEAATISPRGEVTFEKTAEVAFLARYLDKISGVRLTYLRPDPEFVFQAPVPKQKLDELVFAKQQELQLSPAELASDEVFLRRVSLDVTGTLPSPEHAREFLASTATNKREVLIDRLLEREEYAEFWALKWADLMRGSDVTISRRGVHSFHRYLVKQFRDDRSFADFAAETLSSLGNTLNKPGANFHRIARTPDEAAEATAQLFLGVRIGCAKCHNHPFEALTQDDYYGLAAYFARVKFKGKQFMVDDEIVYLDRNSEVRHPTKNVNLVPTAFGEPALNLLPDEDRRKRLVEWLTRRGNPYFARSTVNRVWYHLFGRGIVEPVDDFRETNPPSNPQLLDHLAHVFVENGYRLKPVLRTILNSSTYQLDSRPRGVPSPYAAPAEPYFTRTIPRMLTAEQLLDALTTVTGVPEDFAGYPQGTRAVQLAEGTIEHPFLKAFSKPVRDATCECAREDDPSLSQVIHLLNNPRLLASLNSQQGNLSKWLSLNASDDQILETMYLTTLSRKATTEEQSLLKAHIAKSTDRKQALADIQHALLISNEFLLRH